MRVFCTRRDVLYRSGFDLGITEAVLYLHTDHSVSHQSESMYHYDTP